MPRFEHIKEVEPNLSGAGLHIGIVMSRFNPEVGEGLLAGAAEALQKMGVASTTLTTVPGALEIPLTLQAMAQSGKFDALIALGCVIRGETYHFEVVSNESARGVTDVQLEYRHSRRQRRADHRERRAGACAHAAEGL